jgi:molybdopterin synthase sulfur carrier subunit
MAIEVKIPTILRTYTGGEKVVEAKGDTLSALIDDLDGSHPGIKGRLITDSSTSTSTTRTSASPARSARN